MNRHTESMPVGVRWALSCLGLVFAASLLSPWWTPYARSWQEASLAYCPPTAVYWHGANGAWVAPYVFKTEKRFDAHELRFQCYENRTKPYPLQWFQPQQDATVWGGWRLPIVSTATPATLNWLGTDGVGRDVWSRLWLGGMASLLLGMASLLIAFPLGASLGALAGFRGGWLDVALMRLSEVLMSVPTLFLLVSVAALLPSSMDSLLRFFIISILLASIGWTGLARIVRSLVLSIREQPFIENARLLGVGQGYLLVKHVLPQCFGFLGVLVALSLPGYILSEAGLSFLGFGIQQPNPSWGNLLKEAQELSNLVERPWLMAPAGVLCLLIFSFNRLSDYLNERHKTAL